MRDLGRGRANRLPAERRVFAFYKDATERLCRCPTP
jgi:hypothetical protein